ncbi:hypothetical protein HDU93_000390, partial [Gonapodya sp. JEL0774]
MVRARQMPAGMGNGPPSPITNVASRPLSGIGVARQVPNTVSSAGGGPGITRQDPPTVQSAGRVEDDSAARKQVPGNSTTSRGSAIASDPSTQFAVPKQMGPGSVEVAATNSAAHGIPSGAGVLPLPRPSTATGGSASGTRRAQSSDAGWAQLSRARSTSAHVDRRRKSGGGQGSLGAGRMGEVVEDGGEGTNVGRRPSGVAASGSAERIAAPVPPQQVAARPPAMPPPAARGPVRHSAMRPFPALDTGAGRPPSVAPGRPGTLTSPS